MLLKEFVLESAITSSRNELFENVSEYLTLTLAKLNKRQLDISNKESLDYVDLSHLAIIVTGLKILANPDYRTGLTKREIGINPNDSKDLIAILNRVDKQGKDPRDVLNVFLALCKLAPSGLKQQRQELEAFATGTDDERKKAAQELQKFIIKASQMFNKIKFSSSSTRGVDVASLGEI